jgi:hypothetical protein
MGEVIGASSGGFFLRALTYVCWASDEHRPMELKGMQCRF